MRSVEEIIYTTLSAAETVCFNKTIRVVLARHGHRLNSKQITDHLTRMVNYGEVSSSRYSSPRRTNMTGIGR